MIKFHQLFNIFFGTGMVQLMTFYKGGGGGGSTQTTQNQLDPTVRPFVEYGLTESKALYQTPGPAYYPYQTYVSPSTQTQQALQSAQQRALQGSPLLTSAQGQLQNTIQGSNLGLNPYFVNALQGAGKVATTQFQDALKNIASQSSQAGRYGSGAMADLQSRASQNLADTLVNKAGELAYTNYATERNLQEQALRDAGTLAQQDYADIQQLLNVGQTAEDYQQKALEADIARYEYEQNLPYIKLQNYLSSAYGAPMGQVSTTQSSGGGK